MKKIAKMVDGMHQHILSHGLQNVRELEHILKAYEGYGWHRYASFRANEYLRTVLHEDAQFKVVLICWGTNSETPKHGHCDGGCIMKFLHGRVQEFRYDAAAPDQLMETNDYQKGDIAYIDDSVALHVVKNPFLNVAVSIHIYSDGKVLPRQMREEEFLVML